RLPPLYATTEEGANYQRQRAREELQDLIQTQVKDAIARYLDRPAFFPERQAISSKNTSNVANQLSSLLSDYAPNYEVSE
ncbi:MAG: late competence development ComFB family protein, partial [Waterburya sp.]